MADAAEGQFSGPRSATESLSKAMANNSYEEYRKSLHPATREVDEYGSMEAMKFWTDEFRDLEKKGLDGVFQFEELLAASTTPPEPAGPVKAYPVMGGKRIDEYCLLMKAEGEWKIARMFSKVQQAPPTITRKNDLKI